MPTVCLVLAAASEPATTPQVLEEYRDVQHSIRSSRYGEHVRVDVLPAARPADLAQYLGSARPDVLHFAGRGTPDSGPRFSTGDGGEAPVPLDGFRKAVARAGERGLRLVLLNACWTAHVAEDLGDAVHTAIGWPAEVEDRRAVDYARTFYRNLGDGKSVAEAHNTAVLMLELSGCSAAPDLHSAPGLIPEAHFLIGYELRPFPVVAQGIKPPSFDSAARLRKPRFRPPPHGGH